MGFGFRRGFNKRRKLTGAIGAAPLPPVNSALPAITGTTTEGQTLTVSNGTWANAPTGYTRQWLRNGTAIAGANGATYLLVTADVGANIACRVTASNASGTSSPATAAAVGPIAAAGTGPAPLTAPTLTLTTAAGAAPGFNIANGLIAGNYLRVQRTTVGAGGAGDYTAPALNFAMMIDADDVARGVLTDADLSGFGYTDPTGEYWMRVRWESDSGAVSAWSNEIHDTVVSSVGAFSSASADKNNWITLSNGNLTGTNAGNEGAPCGVRVNPAAKPKSHSELAVTFSGGASGNIGFGITNGASAIGPLNFDRPGLGINGTSIYVGKGGASATIYALVDGNGYAIPGGALANGDRIVMEVDTTLTPGGTATTQVIYYVCRSGSGTKSQIGPAINLAGANRPAANDTHAWASGQFPGDAFTINCGATAFASPVTAGFDIYG